MRASMKCIVRADRYVPPHSFGVAVCIIVLFQEMWQCASVCSCSNVCVCICPRGPNQVSDTFCFGSSLMDEIFICAIDQEGAGPKLSV